MPEEFIKSKEQIVLQTHHSVGNFSYHLPSLTALSTFIVLSISALFLSSQVMKAHSKTPFCLQSTKIKDWRQKNLWTDFPRIGTLRFLRQEKWTKLSLTWTRSFAPLVTLYHPHLSSSAIFLSLSFFSFSISFKISRRRSTSAWALLDSSRYRVTSLSSCCIRSLSSGLALASSVASWACKKKVQEKTLHSHICILQILWLQNAI